MELSYDGFYKSVEKISPDILVVETATVSLMHDLTMINKLPKDIRVVLCGLDYSITQPQFLKNHPRITYVLAGEYELTLLNLIQALRQNKSLEMVLGLIHRDKKGNVVINPTGPLLNVDSLPWPEREDLPMEKYIDAPGGMPLPNVQIIASRGCPFKCIFCAWPQIMYRGAQYRARNVVDVVNEMEYLVGKMKFKSIYFDDDTFNIGRDRMLKFCEEVRKKNEAGVLNVPWAIMARADLMDEEVLVHMADAGLHTVKYGIESADQKLLDNCGKNMNLKQAADMVKFTKSLGINVHLTFTFGLPGETHDTVRKTIDFALGLDPVSLQFSITTPYPGTSYYRELEKRKMLVSVDISDYDGNYRSVINTERLSAAELKEAKDRANYIWGEHCQARRGVKKLALNKIYIDKFKEYMKTYGLYCALKKSANFFSFYIKNNLFVRMIKKYSISNDENWVVFDKGKITLFYSGHAITKDVGLNSSIKCRGRWYDSSCAKWKIVEKQQNLIVIKCDWHYLPIEQIWHVVIGKENIIHWNIEMAVKKDIIVTERKCGILLSEQYTRWSNGEEEGVFPKIYDWQDIPLKDLKSRTIGAIDTREIQGKFPGLKLDFKQHEEAIPQIQNTSREISGRMLQAKFLEEKEFLKGKYKFFSGKIILED